MRGEILKVTISYGQEDLSFGQSLRVGGAATVAGLNRELVTKRARIDVTALDAYPDFQLHRDGDYPQRYLADRKAVRVIR